MGCSTDLNIYKLVTHTEGQGAVIKSPNKSTYKAKSKVSLEAKPKEGWLFDHWEGDIEGSTTTVKLVMDSDKTIVATFVKGYTGVLEDITGSGTQTDPFKINTLAGLKKVGNESEGFSLDAHYQLNANIDIGDDTHSWKAIGDENKGFSGVFNGNGYVIKNLDATPEIIQNHFGIFGYIEETGLVSNLGLVDVIFRCMFCESIGSLGVLAGYNNGVIRHCYLKGVDDDSIYPKSRLDGYNNNMGGLVGYNEGVVSDCFSNLQIDTRPYSVYNDDIYNTGGLVGYNDGFIRSSYSVGFVGGVQKSGGLAGSNMGIIKNSYASVEIHGSKMVGGLAGENRGIITGSYSTGDVYLYSDKQTAGGLVGLNSNMITNSYSLSSIDSFYSGFSKIGGLVGYNKANGTITNTFSATKSFVGGGGLVGENSGEISSSYWDKEYSDIDESDGGNGKTSVQMMKQETFANWDFVDIWNIDGGGSYPYLYWEKD